jgi:hypothetical protein
LNTIKYAHFLLVFIICCNGYVTKLFIFQFHSMFSSFGLMGMSQNCSFFSFIQCFLHLG